jgi:hypothetical protein
MVVLATSVVASVIAVIIVMIIATITPVVVTPVVAVVKDLLGDQRGGGSEWEPIKILLEGDSNSEGMNSLG